MLMFLKTKLKGNRFIYSVYMRLKRSITGELLGMTSKSEQDYLKNYAENDYFGKGKIVDLGCFLGATTIPLVEGVLKNSQIQDADKKIFSYDAFVWYQGMEDAVAGTDIVGKYKEGDSFLGEFQKRTVKFAEWIEVYPGDLTASKWKQGDIEFLLVDAMKNWNLTNSIVKNFYGSLIPEKSYLMHQDFGHYFGSWIHLLQWHHRDYFHFFAEIPASSSVVFKYVKKIPEELLLTELSFESFSNEDIENAFNFCANLVSEKKKPSIYASKIMCFIHQNKFAEAQECLDKLLLQKIDLKNDLSIIQSMLDKAGK
jgi:hypothetical protein